VAQDPLRDHLEFFRELGVDGMRLEPEWRSRAVKENARHEGVEGSAPAGGVNAAGEHSIESPVRKRGAGLVGPAEEESTGSVRKESSLASAEPLVPVFASPGDALAAIKTEIGPHCSRCKLHTLGRTQVVFGVGNPEADLMFVGEAPGADEDIQGEPFVGRAGQLLTKIIEAIGLRREDVYIANVIKCRPPGNRNPEPDEVAECEPFLFRQVDTVKPKVIVALGKFAAQCLLRTTDPITRIRGREFTYRGAILIPTYHPAYLLRNPSAKRDVWEDMKRVRAILPDR
jgi:uracil-DNA glycosylase family 4